LLVNKEDKVNNKGVVCSSPKVIIEKDLLRLNCCASRATNF